MQTTSERRQTRIVGELAYLDVGNGMETTIDQHLLDIPLDYHFRNGTSKRLTVWDHKWHATKNRHSFYAGAHHDGQTVFLARLITSAPLNRIVDHANRDTLDNRQMNLRICNHAQNAVNTERGFKGTSNYRGVSFDLNGRTGWKAQVSVRTLTGKRDRLFLGQFATEEEAALHCDAAYRILYGEFARLNFPGSEPVTLRDRPRRKLDELLANVVASK